MDEVHFTIVRNKSGWYITEFRAAYVHATHGPFEAPINRMEALAFLTTNQLTY